MNAPQLQSRIDKLMELVSPRVGLIKHLTRAVRRANEPTPPIIYYGQLSHFDFRTPQTAERSVAGKGATEEEAIQGAIGEAVERYCGAHANTKYFRRARWADVKDNAVSPEECVLYSERQYSGKEFPYLPWNPEIEIDWMPARELPGDREVYAPAALIYTSYEPTIAEEYLCPPSSNGLAAGSGLEMAVRNALYELIERDGFLVHWFNRLPSPEIDLSSANDLSINIKRHYERFGVETRIFNLTTDLPIYVMMAVSLGSDAETPAALIGLGCSPDPKIAVQKALFEICQIRPGSIDRYLKDKPHEKLKNYSDIHTLDEHHAYFMDVANLHELTFWLEGDRKMSLDALPDNSKGSPGADLAACTEALTKAGCRVIYSDLTTPDVAQYGLKVVRAIATGLQPIHFGYGVERLGGKRLYEVPQRMGYLDRVVAEDSLNLCPHPLA
jgi:ribosomal protein S12 methylthiotransferase accessory factor